MSLLVGDPEMPRHRVQHHPLRGVGPRRALGRRVLDGIAQAVSGLPRGRLGFGIEPECKRSAPRTVSPAMSALRCPPTGIATEDIAE